MSARLHTARDLPAARSRLLAHLAGPAPATWSGQTTYPPGLPADAGPTGYAAWMADRLASAPLLWVQEDLCVLARTAGQALPELSIVPELPPRSDGLVAWADPLPERAPGQGVAVFRCRAAAWSSLDEGLWIELLDQVRLRDPAAAAPEVLRGCPLLPWMGLLLPWAPRVVLGEEWIPAAAEAIRTLVATMLLASQPGLSEHAQVPASPRDRRWLARRGHPADPVAVVRLRATGRRPGTGTAVGSGTPRTHRWLVSGHWRNQPYGPGRSLRRPQWIAPHLAGPADAPFTERVLLLDASSWQPRPPGPPTPRPGD
jgi:hypothetical protein